MYVIHMYLLYMCICASVHVWIGVKCTMYACLYKQAYMCRYIYMYMCIRMIGGITASAVMLAVYIYIYIYICLFDSSRLIDLWSHALYLPTHLPIYVYICIYVYLYICMYARLRPGSRRSAVPGHGDHSYDRLPRPEIRHSRWASYTYAYIYIYICW
jgi:hypothetical protein